LASAGFSFTPYLSCNKITVSQPMKRTFGGLNFDVTSLALGGQASIQWTPSDVDPVKIILKAFELGINYFDTSNAYGPSQLNFGKAFQKLNLIPGQAGYDESLRRSIFLTSKSGLRWAKGGWENEGIRNFSNGEKGSTTIDDVKRSLTQIYGDGKGSYPAGAYLDMVLIHNLNTIEEIDAVYEGLNKPDPKGDNIGALAALRDYRDGTNLTGLNPKEEKLIRHIGFSGHRSPAVMMEMIQRDEENIFDGMLVALNANDRLNFNMQYNVIPVASAKNMGLIAMKVFADGAMYSKEATWSRRPEHVVRTVGSKSLPSRPLVEYALTTPGIHTAIIGIGQIDNNPKMCQLQQNLSAAQIAQNGLSLSDRRRIESLANNAKDGKTNYFQLPEGKLSAPRDPSIEQIMRNEQRIIQLTWQSAYAGDQPIKNYQIWRDNQQLTSIDYIPQTSKKPFLFEDKPNDKTEHKYKIVTIDVTDRSAASEDFIVPSIG
jgi:aryl-alcohol dehydrogenase-like predicted oxidoreductase